MSSVKEQTIYRSLGLHNAIRTCRKNLVALRNLEKYSSRPVLLPSEPIVIIPPAVGPLLGILGVAMVALTLVV